MGGPGCALHRGVKETFAQGQLANPAATPSFFFHFGPFLFMLWYVLFFVGTQYLAWLVVIFLLLADGQ